MKKRKAYLVIELDADEQESILPPHLQGIVSRPLVEPIQTRRASPAMDSSGPADEGWFEGQERRMKERAKAARKAARHGT